MLTELENQLPVTPCIKRRISLSTFLRHDFYLNISENRIETPTNYALRNFVTYHRHLSSKWLRFVAHFFTLVPNSSKHLLNPNKLAEMDVVHLGHMKKQKHLDSNRQ